jgi:hypothetical protein
LNFLKVWIITKSLLLSQLRATSTSRRGSIRSLIRRPRVLGLLDLAAFVLSAGLTYYIAGAIKGSPDSQAFANFVSEAIVILPALLISMILLIGLVFEITSSYQFSSSDTVNWLPVQANEYVIASALALVIYYSPLPVLFIGGTLSLAYTFGLFQAWELGVVLSLFGIFLSASVLEIIRAVLNRFTSSFFKKGGTFAIAVRAIAGAGVLIIFDIMFYPTLYTRFIGAISSNFGPIWFVPILWPSVSISALISGLSTLSASFGLLSVGLTAALFYLAAVVRTKYWVPIPPSIRISTSVYKPKSRPAFLHFFTAAQLAIARKDLRGLVRRKEMLRFLALPGVFLASTILGVTSSGGASFFLYFGVFVVGISSFFVASSSIGAEGKAISNLYQTPLESKDFLLGKLTTPSFFASIIAIVFFSVIGALFERSMIPEIAAFLVISFALSIELSLIGIYVGARFPNFSESPRASYMSQTASLISFPIAAILIGITMAPLFFATLFGTGIELTLIALGASLVITVILSLVFYLMASGQVKQLLSELPY